MKNVMKRWLKQPNIDMDQYLQKTQKQFRFYNSNIYILNHVIFSQNQNALKIQHWFVKTISLRKPEQSLPRKCINESPQVLNTYRDHQRKKYTRNSILSPKSLHSSNIFDNTKPRNTGRTPFNRISCRLVSKQPIKQIKMENNVAKLITTRGKHSDFAFDKGISLISPLKIIENRPERIRRNKEITKSTVDDKLVSDPMPFKSKIDPHCDIPRKNRNDHKKYLRNITKTVKFACSSFKSPEGRITHFGKGLCKNENCSPEICISEIVKNIKIEKKTKVPQKVATNTKKNQKDENARRHLVRSHLNELYTKICVKIKSCVRNKKSNIKLFHKHA